MGQQGSCLDSSLNNSSDSSLTIRLDSSMDSSINNSLVNRLGKQMASSSMLDQLSRRTATRVELKLSLNQQVGGTRTRVTGEASRTAKATAQRQSNLSHSCPSG